MKRIAVFCALICAVVMSLSAQKIYFLELTNVRANANGTEFEVSAGAQSLKVNKFDFEEVAASPSNFFLVICLDKKDKEVTLAKKDSCEYFVTEVLDVEPTNGKWQVNLSGGKYSGYTSSNPEWSTVQPGQHVSYAIVLGMTKRMVCRPYTVGRHIAVTSVPTVTPTPSEPIVFLNEKNEVVGVNKRYDPNL